MQHRLILFCGSSPGAGKSTLSRLLFQQLTAHTIPARWLHEIDMVGAFERFVPEISVSDHTPGHLLQASAALVGWCEVENKTFITDSYLPGYYYLYGRYYDAQIQTYNADLYRTLNPLRPLVVYVRSDVETALLRGVHQRGEQWLENITRYLNGWMLPLYGGEPKPLRTVADVIDFCARVDQLTVTLLAEWQNVLILEATETPIPQLLGAMLDHLELVVLPIQYVMTVADLERYTGVYTRSDAEHADQQLEITIRNDALFVNTYWPAGARLFPQSATQFNLDGVNRSISFELDVQENPYSLTYDMGQTIQRYKKIG